ncbi:MAG: hypothetical protein ACQEQF_01835 [Bacillota bacterium]
MKVRINDKYGIRSDALQCILCEIIEKEDGNVEIKELKEQIGENTELDFS